MFVLRSFFLKSFLLIFLSVPALSFSQEITLGAQMGAMGVIDPDIEAYEDPDLPWGAFLMVNANDWIALQVDYLRTKMEDQEFQLLSPAALMYFAHYEEFRLGFLGGAGFYKLPEANKDFGLNVGATGELTVGKNFFLGLQGRFHYLFGEDNIWSTTLKLGFRFETGSGWDW